MNIPDILEKIDELTNTERTDLVRETVDKLTKKEKQEVAINSVQTLSPAEKTEVLREATTNLSEQQKIAVAEAILGKPTQQATDTLWLIIVIVFATAFILSVAAMIYAAIFTKDGIDDKLITIFTTTSAFLAGLLAPSPTNG